VAGYEVGMSLNLVDVLGQERAVQLAAEWVML
jgi:hypothetical protein